MGCIGTMSLAGGFGYAISASRKSDPVMFSEVNIIELMDKRRLRVIS